VPPRWGSHDVAALLRCSAGHVKVLQVHTRYRRSGGEDAVVATEAGLLRDAGHTVVPHLAANPPGRLDAGLNFATAVWNRSAAADVRRVASEVRPDVVHVHNTWFGLSPAILPSLRSLGLPVVMTLHNYRLVCAAATLVRDGAPCLDCVGTHPWHAVQHRCYRGSRAQSIVAATSIAVHQARRTWHKDVDRFLALTAFGRDLFVAGGLPAERIVVKSNSVPDPGPRLQPPSSSDTVVFLGRLTLEKGIADLVDAWRSIPPPLELLVVGEGPLLDSLRARAPDRVSFSGWLPPEDIEPLLLRARALVFPSVSHEGQGLVALEAAAAGLPVLFSDLGAMAGIFAPGADELAMPPGDPAGMATFLARLADDEFVDRHGAFCRRRFDERYTHEVATSRLEAIYREAATSRQ
jgi:glycosyltransferase involved in cell wall biosynthesis